VRCGTRPGLIQRELYDGLKPMLFADDVVSLHSQLAQQQVIGQRMAGGAT